MPRPKTKSKLTLSLPEAIINLKNDNTNKPYKILFINDKKSLHLEQIDNGNGTVTVTVRYRTLRYGERYGNA